MKSFFVIICLLVTISCKQDFCELDKSKRNELIISQLDSLINNESEFQGLRDYKTLLELEFIASTSKRKSDLYGGIRYEDTDESTCIVTLNQLEFMNSTPYFKSDVKNYKSFIPVLFTNLEGRITRVELRLTLVNDSSYTIKSDQFDLAQLLDDKKINRLKTSKSKRVAQAVTDKLNEYNKNVQLAEKQRLKERQEQIIAEQNQKKEEDRKFKEKVKNAYKAADLIRYYLDNEVKANNRFLNKRITLKGEVDQVSETNGQVIIYLKGSNYVNSVACYTKDNVNAAKLTRGQGILIEGTCLGLDAINLYVEIDDTQILGL